MKENVKKRFLKSLNLKGKEVKMMKKSVLIAMLMVVAMVCMSTAAFAVPTLGTTYTNKFKFTNYEDWLGTGDVNGNGRINAGEKMYVNDAFEGIFTITTISNIPETIVTWTPTAGVDELTGYFKNTITGIAGLTTTGWVTGTALTDYMTLGGPSGYSATMTIGGTTYDVIDTMFRFGLESGDVFEMKYQSGTTNWDPNLSKSQAKLNAQDGDPYLKVTGGDMLEFYSYYSFYLNDTQLRAWYDLTENNTGYPFARDTWGVPHWWPWDATVHPAIMSDMYMEGSIYIPQALGTGDTAVRIQPTATLFLNRRLCYSWVLV
ncbi:MAG: hypothetical protein Q8O04_11090 [Deltaproteobacteria bacterium]|nr:hypothetical protein [Deltaproteobacteria bacterium]